MFASSPTLDIDTIRIARQAANIQSLPLPVTVLAIHDQFHLAGTKGAGLIPFAPAAVAAGPRRVGRARGSTADEGAESALELFKGGVADEEGSVGG